VRQYISAGVAGMHIEDQVQTKRCGHLMGKQVVSREEFLTRIRAAVIARDSLPGGSDFVSPSLQKVKIHVLKQHPGYHWSNGFSSGSWNGGSRHSSQIGS
jgi:hypothetical protein